MKIAIVSMVFLAVGCTGNRNDLAATVNGQPITMQAYKAAIRMYTKPGTGEIIEPKSKILESLINQKLVLAEAAKAGFVIDESEVNKSVKRLEKTNPILFKTISKRTGVDQYRKNLKAWALFEQMRRLVVKDETVTAKEISTYYRAKKEQFRMPAQADLLVYEDRTYKEVLGEAYKAAQQERSKTDNAAKSNPESRWVGWQAVEDLPKKLAATINTLKVGEVSKPIKLTKTYVVVQIRGRRKSQIQSLPEAQRDISQKLLERKQDRVFKQWIERLRAKSQVWRNSSAVSDSVGSVQAN